MSYIERRRNLWYATLVIPLDVRPKLGKFKFIQSLGTADKRQAHSLAAPVIAKWKAIIRRERGEGDAVTIEALRWREVLAEISADNTEGHEATQDQIVSLAERIERDADYTTAKRFADIALGVTMPSAVHFAEWKAQLDLAPKTQDQMVKDVQSLITRFPTLQDITHQAVKRWLDELTERGVSSHERILSSSRNYWRYLQDQNVVPSDAQPLTQPSRKKARKKRSNGGSWIPFTPDDVMKLWKAAGERQHKGASDAILADLILLGAYTGARIEELCSLKIEHITEHRSFKIMDAKTDAGVREVPIHTAIRPLVKRLKKASNDGYLLSGLTFNKYGDRSNAIGKRFGRLKESLGYGEQHVFHSIRKTLVTLLENAGISENLAADIVGHEKPRITYGLYSGGASLAVKADALERVKYPAVRPQ